MSRIAERLTRLEGHVAVLDRVIVIGYRNAPGEPETFGACLGGDAVAQQQAEKGWRAEQAKKARLHATTARTRRVSTAPAAPAASATETTSFR